MNSFIIIVAAKHSYCILFADSTWLTESGPKHWDEIHKEISVMPSA